MKKDYAIQVASSILRYGIGVTNEVGMVFKDMGVIIKITEQNTHPDSQPDKHKFSSGPSDL